MVEEQKREFVAKYKSVKLNGISSSVNRELMNPVNSFRQGEKGTRTPACRHRLDIYTGPHLILFIMAK